ncbi:MAG: plasmid pRiA4b ORF-3 family protein [Nitrosospira sp.]|nr:plasmid pRiA4b ORF-3 family protein [Nitrosospira sp.]
MKKESKPVQIYQIKIALKGLKPMIWRRVHVRSDITLAKLHDVIQIAMGWTDSHLHQFVIGGERYCTQGMFEDFGDKTEDEKRVRLDQVATLQSRFVYEYDFGDDWVHEIKVEKIIEFQAGIKTPHCVAGKHASPPEDCGGIWGYRNMLEQLAGPPSEERAELIEWLGEEFDPQRFELQEINEILQRLRK